MKLAKHLFLVLLLCVAISGKAQLDLPLAGTPVPTALTPAEQTELNNTGLLPSSAVERANWYILTLGRHRIPLVAFNNYTHPNQELPLDNMWITSLAITGDDSQLWAFIGDESKGYLLFNRDTRKPLIMARLPEGQIADDHGYIMFGGKQYFQTADVQPANNVGYPFKQQNNDFYARVVFDTEVRSKVDNTQNRQGYGNWIMNNKSKLFSIKDKASNNRLVQYPKNFGSAAKFYAEPPSIVGAYLYDFNGTSFADITLPMAKKHVATAGVYAGTRKASSAVALKNAIVAYEANTANVALRNAVRAEYTKFLMGRQYFSELYSGTEKMYLINASSIPYTLTRQTDKVMGVRGHLKGVVATEKPLWASGAGLEEKVGYFSKEENFNNSVWSVKRFGLVPQKKDSKNAFELFLYLNQNGASPLDRASEDGLLVYESPEPGFFVLCKRTRAQSGLSHGISGENYDLGGRQQEHFFKIDSGTGQIVQGGNGDDGAIYSNSWFALMPIGSHTIRFNDEGFSTYTPVEHNTLMSEKVIPHKVVMADYSDEATIEAIDGDVMSKGTGYVIKGTPSTTVSVYQTIYDESDAKNNLLVGVTTATTLPNRVFVLTQLTKDDGSAYKGNYRTGFYTTKQNAPTIPAGKAYIPLNIGSRANAFVFPDFTVTNILTPQWDINSREQRVFDLNGIQQQRIRKGLNIINGRKVYINNENQ